MSDTGTTVRFVPTSRIAARIIDGRAVVVVVDRQELHTLNVVGTRIWQLLPANDLDAVARALVEEFDVDLERARKDVSEFCEGLEKLGALERRAT